VSVLSGEDQRAIARPSTKSLGMIMDSNELAKIIESAFRFLEVKYGFTKLGVKNYGREVFIEYERDVDTVSISIEIGSAPLVEIFIPSEGTDHKPIPWAAKNNIQRARLFPKIKVNKEFQISDPVIVAEYFGEMANQFETSQAAWLNA